MYLFSDVGQIQCSLIVKYRHAHVVDDSVLFVKCSLTITKALAKALQRFAISIHVDLYNDQAGCSMAECALFGKPCRLEVPLSD